jgi:flagellar basal-body rod protein FlgG
MIKGLYAAEAAMKPKMARLEVISNNLANMSSTGFKRDKVFLRLLQDSAARQARGTGELDGIGLERVIDFAPGALERTGNPLDLAIEGRGFFVVETPAGPRYTRNGHLTIAADGTLTTEMGFPITGEQGRIKVPDPDRLDRTAVTVTPEGEVAIGRDSIGTLALVDFENLNDLRKDHQSLFLPAPGAVLTERTGDQLVVRQGFLEESNVDAVEEMIAMIELSRAFETDQRIIAAQDASLDRSLDVGRV